MIVTDNPAVTLTKTKEELLQCSANELREFPVAFYTAVVYPSRIMSFFLFPTVILPVRAPHCWRVDSPPSSS